MKGIGKSKVFVMALLGLSAFSPMMAIVAKTGKTEAVAEASSVSQMRKTGNSRTPREPATYGFDVDVLGLWRAEESALAAARQRVRSYLEQVAGYEGLSLDGAQYTYNDLYYENNERAGYVVDFSIDGKDGYAIFFMIEGEPTLAEINFDARSPYRGRAGKYLYPSFGTYAVKDDFGNVEVLQEDNNFAMSSDKGDEKKDVRETKNIAYSYGYLVESDENSKLCKLLNYSYTTDLVDDLDNICANVAGVIAINYWNKLYGNNLLNLSYEEVDDKLNMDTDTAKAYIRKFYKYMNTNWILGQWGGSLPWNVYGGFENFIKDINKGFKTKRTELSNYSEIKSFISKNVPVFIVSDDYYFTYYPEMTLPNVSEVKGNNMVTFDYSHTWGLVNAHSFVGFGYAEYDLYDSNGNCNKLEFVRVADGWYYSRYFNVKLSRMLSAAAIEVIELSGC